jgi:hypothetical protein
MQLADPAQHLSVQLNLCLPAGVQEGDSLFCLEINGKPEEPPDGLEDPL